MSHMLVSFQFPLASTWTLEDFKAAIAEDVSSPPISNANLKVKRVFLDGTPTSWDYYHVNECLEKFGQIEKIELARYKESAKRKDFGFVTFDSHNAAVACVEFVNSTEFNEGENKVKVRASLSDPIKKWQWNDQVWKWKHQVRGGFPVGRDPASTDVRVSWSSLPHHNHRHLRREITHIMEQVEYREAELSPCLNQ